MRRPPVATILTYFVYIALAAVVTFAFFAQSHRIALSDERYDELFAAYQQLDRDCATADDCTTDAPSPDEVAESSESGAQGAPGTNGTDGRDGRTPSSGELLQLIQLYCSANDGCRGAPGSPGAAGSPGDTVVGPPGPAGADGAPGASGADGAPGPAGAGVASVTCVQTDLLTTAFRFTFTDGTTNDVQGSCTPNS
jgi:hypothetical protein